MAEHLCACGQPARDSTLCGGCTRRLELVLGDTPAIVADLEVTIARLRSPGLDGGSRSAETPLPWHDKAARIARELHDTLATWVRLVHEEQAHPRPWPTDRTSALAGWLLAEVRWLRLHDAAAECLSEIAHAIDEARKVVDRPPDREFVGVCHALVLGVRCWETLYAIRGRNEVHCPTCGTEHEVEERRKANYAIVDDVLAQASEIVRAVAWCGEYVRKQQISTWAQVGRLEVRGHKGTHALYRIGDVLDLLASDTRAAAS